MFNNSKYSNVLTIVLVIAIILVISIIGIIIFRIYRSKNLASDAALAATAFEEQTNTNNNIASNKVDITGVDGTNIVVTDSQASTSNPNKYKGFNVVGTIEIPKINMKYPILEKLTKKSLETSVVLLYTAQGVNEPGNTVIIGHNYRNSTMFSKVKNLSNGDIIYITDAQGRKIEYEVYNKYNTSGNDGEYITRNTQGAREISLSTCTDDSKARTIVWAKEKTH